LIGRKSQQFFVVLAVLTLQFVV